jgi:hypothetical protein
MKKDVPLLNDSELKAAMAQARTFVPLGSTWRHKKGHEYFIVGHCVLAGYRVPAVLCRGTDSVIWCRPATQFLDGRLTRVDMIGSHESTAQSGLLGPTEIPDSHAGE